jgi:hypothetical protein
MFGWLKSRKPPSPVPLTGAPPVRRLKTYHALTGYVYQYTYEGRRPAAEPGTEYVFQVTADRKTFQAVSVFVLASALGPWEQAHGRPLHPQEHYALAKLGLAAMFDERPPSQIAEPVHLTAGDVAAIAAQLNF